MIYLKTLTGISRHIGNKNYPAGVYSFSLYDIVPLILRYSAELIFEQSAERNIQFIKCRTNGAPDDKEIMVMVLQSKFVK